MASRVIATLGNGATVTLTWNDATLVWESLTITSKAQPLNMRLDRLTETKERFDSSRTTVYDLTGKGLAWTRVSIGGGLTELRPPPDLQLEFKDTA